MTYGRLPILNVLMPSGSMSMAKANFAAPCTFERGSLKMNLTASPMVVIESNSSPSLTSSTKGDVTLASRRMRR